ncbi:MAG: hypothetical protein GY754_23355 [bacterium]|nr:hypothetical protein [bacterium]
MIKKLTILLVLLTGCSSYSLGPYKGEGLFTPPGDFPKKSEESVLNYEEKAGKSTIISIDTHYRIHIQTEKPYIITPPAPEDLPRIYKVSGLKGTAVFLADVDTEGSIRSYSLAKSAGMGLDEIAETILKKIKLSPGKHAYKESASKIFIRIEFRWKEKI